MTALASKPYTGTLTLEWRGDGSLWALRGYEERVVSVRRCFRGRSPRPLVLRDSRRSGVRSGAGSRRARSTLARGAGDGARGGGVRGSR